MRRFGIEGLLELLFQFGIVLIPLALALIGPLIGKLAKKRAAGVPREPVVRRVRDEAGPGAAREPGAQRVRDEAGRRAEADLTGSMKHVEQAARAEPTGRQVQDERTVIQEIRRLMENRAREAADESPAQERPAADRREAARVREVSAEKLRSGAKEAPVPRQFQSVADAMDQHQALSLEARGALKDAEAGSAASATKAAAPVLRLRPAVGFKSLLRQDPAFVLLSAEVFGPCRAAAGLEGSPMAPSSLRPWG